MIGFLLVLLLQAPSVPRGSIGGIVIDAGGTPLQPLYGARLDLARDAGSAIVLRTDESGRFVFQDLDAGRYRLSVTRDGFLRKSTTVTINAGQHVNDLRFALEVAPTLFGRVRDPNNIPVENILVEAIKVVYGPRGDKSVISVESALSDDRGEYHLYWIDPGEYYIRASSLPLKPGGAIPCNLSLPAGVTR